MNGLLSVSVCVQYQWSGEPVITFSGFDGQLTDVQVWDYPLRYKEVLYYMSHGYYGYDTNVCHQQ